MKKKFWEFVLFTSIKIGKGLCWIFSTRIGSYVYFILSLVLAFLMVIFSFIFKFIFVILIGIFSLFHCVKNRIFKIFEMFTQFSSNKIMNEFDEEYEFLKLIEKETDVSTIYNKMCDYMANKRENNSEESREENVN